MIATPFSLEQNDPRVWELHVTAVFLKNKNIKVTFG